MTSLAAETALTPLEMSSSCPHFLQPVREGIYISFHKRRGNRSPDRRDFAGPSVGDTMNNPEGATFLFGGGFSRYVPREDY